MVAAIDMDGDKRDELLVGAPLFNGRAAEEGRVFIYTSDGIGVCSTSIIYDDDN